MMPTLAASADGYRLGFAELDREVAIAALPVRGRVPAWLTGSLLRNGPGRFTVGAERYRHWFDGLAMLHRFGIRNGAVSYANRFLQSPAYLQAQRTQRIACSEFATHPSYSPLEALAARFRAHASHNANVNIAPFGDAYLALTETPSPVRFDGTSLATMGVLAWDDAVRGQMTTAHPISDPARRATFNLVTEVGRTSVYQIVRIEDGTLRRTVIGTHRVDAPAYIHAISATTRAVVAEYPLVVRPLDLMFMRNSFIDNYRWKPERGARFHVFDKDGRGRLASFEAEAFFAFHHVNAHDDGDAIVIDVCGYDDPAIVDEFLLDRVLAPEATFARPSLRRYRLVPGDASARLELRSPQSLELPRVAPRSAGAAYRFAYGVDSDAGERSIFDRLVKFDVVAETATVWSQPRAYPGEAVFVARPDAIDEDDGVVLSVVLDADQAASFLLVLDARTMLEIARAEVPHAIPFGFHGIFGAD